MKRLFPLLVLILVSESCWGAPSSKADQAKDWWETSVFYQIYPRSFKDSDGDGIGDLGGIIEKLDHLHDMGVGATWLSPIFTSPMYDFGYDIADFYNIDPTFGTMEDFDNLIKKAKELDIKIILDFVPNHSSTEGEWFLESLNASSPKADWFVWEDPSGFDADGYPLPPNNWVSVFRYSAWEYREERGQFYLHQFAKQQPDLNYRNREVVEEMKNVLRYWLEKGVGGFRIDAINHLFEVSKDDYNGVYPDEPLTGYPDQGPDDYGYVDHIFTKDQPETLDMVYQWREIFDEYTKKDGVTKVMLTEAYTDIKTTMAYYGNGTHKGSHMPFNFGLITDANKYSWAQDIKYVTDRWLTYMPLDQTANWVIGNHDQARVATRYGAELVDALSALVLLLPGVGITYAGEEIGMENTWISWEDTVDPAACNTNESVYESSSRDPARTPFQWDSSENAGFSTNQSTWLPINENYLELNLADQKKNLTSHFNIYKRLVALRSLPSFKYGRYQSVALSKEVFAFRRYYMGDSTYVVVINLSELDVTVNLHYLDDIGDELEIIEASVHSDKEIGSMINAKELQLDPFELLVLKSGAGTFSLALTTGLFSFILNKLFKNVN